MSKMSLAFTLISLLLAAGCGAGKDHSQPETSKGSALEKDKSSKTDRSRGTGVNNGVLPDETRITCEGESESGSLVAFVFAQPPYRSTSDASLTIDGHDAVAMKCEKAPVQKGSTVLWNCAGSSPSEGTLRVIVRKQGTGLFVDLTQDQSLPLPALKIVSLSCDDGK